MVREALPETMRFSAQIVLLVALAVGFATSHAQSMKSFTSGLSVRFLNVIAAIGRGAIGNLIGNPCKIGLLDGNCNAEPGRMVRKRPLPSRAFLTGTADVMIAAFGTLRPLARKASLTTDPNELWGGGSTQASFANSASLSFLRFVHGLCTPAATTNGSS